MPSRPDRVSRVTQHRQRVRQSRGNRRTRSNGKHPTQVIQPPERIAHVATISLRREERREMIRPASRGKDAGTLCQHADYAADAETCSETVVGSDDDNSTEVCNSDPGLTSRKR